MFNLKIFISAEVFVLFLTTMTQPLSAVLSLQSTTAFYVCRPRNFFFTNSTLLLLLIHDVKSQLSMFFILFMQDCCLNE